nr:MAG TPA: hypothetical protein [Caudoviricetes sp.]
MNPQFRRIDCQRKFFFLFHKGAIKNPPKTGVNIRIKTVRTKKLAVLLTKI